MENDTIELFSVILDGQESPDEVQVIYSDDFKELDSDAADDLALRAVYSILMGISAKRTAKHGAEWAAANPFNLPTC
jgi:hypothetical protein